MQKLAKFSNGERATLSALDISSCVLTRADERLGLAGEELLRMEDEGGIALTKSQTEKVSVYAKARKRVKTLLVTSGYYLISKKAKEN